MIRKRSFTSELPPAQRRNHRLQPTDDTQPPRNAAEAGQRAIACLNKEDLQGFCALLEQMAEQGITTLDLSHRPDRPGVSRQAPLLSKEAVECLAVAFERNAWPDIHALDLAGARVGTIEPLLKTLQDKHGNHLQDLDFSGTRIVKDGKPYPLQPRHFQRIAQIVADAPHIRRLALNQQPLLKGQRAGAARRLDASMAHLQRYMPDPSDTDVASSLPELVAGVCVSATKGRLKQLELRQCNLSDADLDTLFATIDPSKSLPVDSELLRLRKQLKVLDVRGNPMESYGNRLVQLGQVLHPDGELQMLYLPSHLQKAYDSLYEGDLTEFHARLSASSLQVLEPLSSKCQGVKSVLAPHRTGYDVWAEPIEPPPLDLGTLELVDPLICI